MADTDFAETGTEDDFYAGLGVTPPDEDGGEEQTIESDDQRPDPDHGYAVDPDDGSVLVGANGKPLSVKSFSDWQARFNRHASEATRWQREAEERQAKLDELDQQRKLVEEAFLKDQQAGSVPDKDTAPVDYLSHQFTSRLDRLQAQMDEQQRQQAQQRYESEMASWMGSARDWLMQDTQSFINDGAADYQDAVNYYISVEAQKKMRMDGVSQDQAIAVVLDEMLQQALNLYQQGVSPARLMYATAQQYGYQPNGNGGGAAHPEPAAQASPALRAPQVSGELARKRGLQADSLSLSGPGTQPGAAVAPPGLDDVPDDQLEALLDHLGDDGDIEKALARFSG